MKENKKTNWLFVKFESRGEKEVSWIKDKTFKEIEESCKEKYKKNIEEEMWGIEDDEREECLEEIMEFCNYSSKEGVGVEYGLSEESRVGYYNESIVKEMMEVDLDKLNEEGWDSKYIKYVDDVIDKIDGICF